MNTTRNTTTDLARLETVFDTYGADPARWPEDERAGLEHLIDSDERAARLAAEAAALDRVMAHDPAGDANEGLKRRILAAAVNDGGREARVVPMTASRRPAATVAISRRAALWPAAALAASFALGLYLGLSGLGGTAIDSALRYAQFNGGEAGQAIWLTDAPDGGSEELL